YTIKASNGTDVSSESNEVAVTLLATGLDETKSTALKVHTIPGAIVVKAAIGEVVRIYDVLGSLLKEVIATDGDLTVYVNSERIYIVRGGSSNAKVFVK
ncbi:MAG: hypothetical protein ACK5MK_11855, partial [Dysgonomonas sp.]